MNKKSAKQINQSLKNTLLERIEAEQVCPRSRMFFRGRECLVWFLWSISVVVGAFAIAVSLFVVTHRQYELYEATHDNFFTFMVEMLPYLWIVVFGLMVYVAVYNLRHTKHGYRYPLWMILASSVVLSFAGGSALQFFGFGYSIDNVLGRNMEMYMSQDKLEQKMWQAPSEGRLLGKQVFTTLSPEEFVVFEDATGQRWRMDVSELQSRDMELLASEKTVRMLGLTKNNELFIFHACGALPWMIEREVTVDDMNRERKAFLQRVYSHSLREDERSALLEGETFASTSLPKRSVCADLTAMRRMPVTEP